MKEKGPNCPTSITAYFDNQKTGGTMILTQRVQDMLHDMSYSQLNPVYQSLVTGTPQYSFLLLSFGIIFCAYTIVVVIAIIPAIHILRHLKYSKWRWPSFICYCITGVVLLSASLPYIGTIEDGLYSLSHHDINKRVNILCAIADGRIQFQFKNGGIPLNKIATSEKEAGTTQKTTKINRIYKDVSGGYYAELEDEHGGRWGWPTIALINNQTMRLFNQLH